MIRVVADTNVLISALVFGGLPGVFLNRALLRSFDLVTSAIMLDELDEKLRAKFEIGSVQAIAIRSRLEESSILVAPEISLSVIRDDPDDDRVLECAVSGSANFIVSGDRHLLAIREYNGIEIVRVREFLDRSVVVA